MLSKSVAISSALILLVSCGNSSGEFDPNGRLTDKGRENQSRYVSEQCSQESIVGQTASTDRILTLKRQELDEASVTLTTTRKNQLSQTLAGFSAEWQNLKNEVDQACRRSAACLFAKQEQAGVCKRQLEQERQTRRETREFTAKVLALGISN